MKGSGGLELRLFDEYRPCTSLEGAIAKSSLLAFHRPEQKPLLLLGLGFQRLFWQTEHNSCSAMQGSGIPRGGGCSKAWCPVPSPAPTSCLPPPFSIRAGTALTLSVPAAQAQSRGWVSLRLRCPGTQSRWLQLTHTFSLHDGLFYCSVFHCCEATLLSTLFSSCKSQYLLACKSEPFHCSVTSEL